MKENILIAVSDGKLSVAIKEILEKEGYKTIVARDGREALDQMKKQNPDLALIDTTLSVVDGYEVLTAKSFDRFITKIPVIVVSNSGTPIEMHRLPATPTMKDYLIKSHVEPEEVLEKVRKVLGGSTGGSPNASKNTSKKILWVEDDKLLGSILSKKIESSGHKLLKANDGEQALKILETETPDIIILDILLPGMSGFDTLQAIKQNEKFRKIPAMMLSNMSKQSDIEKAKMLGVSRFLVKAAVSLDEIIREINSVA